MAHSSASSVLCSRILDCSLKGSKCSLSLVGGAPWFTGETKIRQNGSPSDGHKSVDTKVSKRRQRRANRRQRRWKPYFKLSWEEKKQLDERETLRAARVRAEMFAKGQPVAPYNTTQFLMEDHDQEEPDLKTDLFPWRPLAIKLDEINEESFLEKEDGGSSSGIGGDSGEFLQRDFLETYEKYHVESLQNMSKEELIREYLELEKCLCQMEEENNRLRLESKKGGRSREPGNSSSGIKELQSERDLSREEVTKRPWASRQEQSQIKELEFEIKRIQTENLRLTMENQLFQKQKNNPKIM
ncbi:protein HEXIM1-like isoform X2 [Rhinatrema bivittatum]|nr:protein HEXIM1-like isoform X2 [Rhinatrema bivittatum]XP_029429591.1 protein HEXIM1-like isoform X2 [Rhinatrema bivittatum]XP_029429592.1 protein HEXIM1-like isoform X2 [Rhinatrema bivittatum]XP_029429593.1 protein HEXIM1-like isoform X2 [Rhinatrema bivittatum]XP_029429594.1 protein HEXIM1-like isoform X2 [Rhinatrema bivittatum]XP_029429595.1 protein HEXIM1-like isoform X2 [Rhinatrema bivittatum]XP_029429596.1 protein HEXIM1-like isoform X2 [Rhinatrema bivittatum]XP_029429597.1 protein HE